jgi:hypothetical protein
LLYLLQANQRNSESSPSNQVSAAGLVQAKVGVKVFCLWSVSAYSSTLSLSLGGYVENNEFQGMGKEEAVVGFEILSSSYSVGTEEDHDESVETVPGPI